MPGFRKALLASVLAIASVAGCSQPSGPAALPADSGERHANAPGTGNENATCSPELTFVAATVYAGATDYYFQTKDGLEIRYRVENEETHAKGFDQLTVMGDEGPPETNSSKVGAQFTVCEQEGKIEAIAR